MSLREAPLRGWAESYGPTGDTSLPVLNKGIAFPEKVSVREDPVPCCFLRTRPGFVRQLFADRMQVLRCDQAPDLANGSTRSAC
jgi:hypothetical protein